MTLDLRKPLELRLTLADFLKGVPEDFPEVITGRRMIPEANNIFQVRPEYKRTLLDEELVTDIHHKVTELQFITSKSKKDIKMAIFLCN